uniref:Small ribosomal subunit protein mS33 n=2 Tax=Sus scrofa TaxID=9823 RepID=A0A8D1R9N6_PIG
MRDGFRAPAEVSSLVVSPRIGRVNFINQLGGLTGTLAPAAQEMSSLSEYAVRMSRLSARLFGEVARPTDSKSMKVVKLFSEQPLAKRKETYDWYPNHNTYFALMGTLRFLGLYRDEHQDFRDEQLRLKKLRGKGKPRKGEGKRAMKKK